MALLDVHLWRYDCHYVDDPLLRFPYPGVSRMWHSCGWTSKLTLQKWLAAKNRDVACIAALQKIAKTNRTTCTLTVEDLQNASMKVGVDPTDAGMSIMQTLKNSLSKLSLSNITPLFSTTRLAINTTLITLIWGLIGLAYVSFHRVVISG
jgi:hypothetical protein